MALPTRWTELQVKSTFSQQLCKRGHTFTHGEIDIDGNDENKQVLPEPLSPHFRNAVGRELRNKCSDLQQISHCAELRGHTLTARPWAEPRDALANVVFIMTLLGRVYFSILQRG